MSQSTDKAVTRARATPTETAARVETIADMMRRGLWLRGDSAPLLAEQWGLAIATVEALSAEASRIVAREVQDPKAMRDEVATVLRENLHRASQAGEFKAVASLGDVVTKILGARAPEKHEHVHAGARYDGMSDADRLAWLDEMIAKFTEERARVSARMGVVSAGAGVSLPPVRR